MVNTLRPRQNGRRFTDDTFKRIFLNENVRISIKISLMFVPKGPINNIPALVQIMAWRRPGDKPLSESMMVNLLTHICVTRPQWVKHKTVVTRSSALTRELPQSCIKPSKWMINNRFPWYMHFFTKAICKKRVNTIIIENLPDILHRATCPLPQMHPHRAHQNSEKWSITYEDGQLLRLNVLVQSNLLNSLWPSDALWRQRSGSTLAQVMVCCLTASSHYLNQCWLIISEVQWHSY